MVLPNKSKEEILIDKNFEHILDNDGEYLLRLAFFYVKDWATAEDIIQEVFISYYLKSNQFESRSSIRTYLSKITINKCHDYLRSWKNNSLFFSNYLGYLKSNNTNPEELLEIHSDQRNLSQFIVSLPIKYREVIILYYYQELSIKEISYLLNCSENTIKTRMKRGRNLLQIKINIYEMEELQDE